MGLHYLLVHSATLGELQLKIQLNRNSKKNYGKLPIFLQSYPENCLIKINNILKNKRSILYLAPTVIQNEKLYLWRTARNKAILPEAILRGTGVLLNFLNNECA